MLSGEGQHHLASAAVAVCKGIECLLEVLCLEHMRGDLIDLFQVVRQDLDHLGELLVLMTGPQNGQFLCIDLLEVHGDRLLAKGHSHQTACGRKLAGCMCQQCGNACGLKDHVDTLAVGQFVDERMDTNRVEARFKDGTTLAIDCIAVEDEYGNTPAQRAELDWLLYNKPLEYAQLVLGGEIEHYLSLGCDHGRLED